MSQLTASDQSRHFHEPTQTATTRIEAHLNQSSATLQKTADACADAIVRAAERITECFVSGGKLLICGNGGSAAESQHMAAELTHRLSAAVQRRALPAIALTTDTSFLTACANDHGFNHVFSRQVEALGKPGDVLLGLSTSGNSRNVLAAFHTARSLGLSLIALTGSEGEMRSLADVAICIPSTDTQFIQEAHLPIVHLLCALCEQSFVG